MEPFRSLRDILLCNLKIIIEKPSRKLSCQAKYKSSKMGRDQGSYLLFPFFPSEHLLFIRLTKLFSIHVGRNSYVFFELYVEVGNVVKTAERGDVQNAFVGIG